MHHSWSVICSDTSLDSETNNISLFKIIENITFSTDGFDDDVREKHGHLPIPLNFVVVSLWWRSDINKAETGLSRMILVTPSNERIQLAEVSVDLRSNTRTRNIGRLQGFPFYESGVYYVTIQLKENDDWKTVAEIPLEIIQVAQPETH